MEKMSIFGPKLENIWGNCGERAALFTKTLTLQFLGSPFSHRGN